MPMITLKFGRNRKSKQDLNKNALIFIKAKKEFPPRVDDEEINE